MALMKRIHINLYIGYNLVSNRFERSLLFCDELFIYIFASETREYNIYEISLTLVNLFLSAQIRKLKLSNLAYRQASSRYHTHPRTAE